MLLFLQAVLEQTFEDIAAHSPSAAAHHLQTKKNCLGILREIAGSASPRVASFFRPLLQPLANLIKRADHVALSWAVDTVAALLQGVLGSEVERVIDSTLAGARAAHAADSGSTTLQGSQHLAMILEQHTSRSDATNDPMFLATQSLENFRAKRNVQVQDLTLEKQVLRMHINDVENALVGNQDDDNECRKLETQLYSQLVTPCNLSNSAAALLLVTVRAAACDCCVSFTVPIMFVADVLLVVWCRCTKSMLNTQTNTAAFAQSCRRAEQPAALQHLSCFADGWYGRRGLANSCS